MVTILFKFINAFRSRNWLAHLNTLEKVMPYTIAMDRIKYRRMPPVYLSDMWALEEREPDLKFINLKFFLDRHFSVQINHVPGTANSVEHADKQENKKLMIQVALICIKRRENRRSKFFLILQVVSEIERRTNRNLSFTEGKNKNSPCIELKYN